LVSGDLGSARLRHDDTSLLGEFDAPRDRVWEALLLAQQELELPLVASDPKAAQASFFLQSYNHRIAGKKASTYVDCGSGPMGNNADLQRINVAIHASVNSPTPNHSVLRISLVASSRPVSLSSNELACSTFGLLEKRIVELVGSHLKP
jgi:hypothetical protein